MVPFPRTMPRQLAAQGCEQTTRATATATARQRTDEPRVQRRRSMMTRKDSTVCSPLQQLAYGLYYAPHPALTVDAEGRVLDYNLALDVLAGNVLNSHRDLPLDGWAQQLERRMTQGTLLPGTNGLARTKCSLNVEGLGSVHLVGTQIVCDDPATSKTIGRIVSWEVIAADGKDWFHKKYRERHDQQLIWDIYASSYDRILNLMPYYREVVDRHRVALTATAPGPLVDLGAGTGNLAEVLLISTDRAVTVVDNSRAMLHKLRSKSALAAEVNKRLTIIEASAECLPIIGDGAFAGVSILLALFDMQAPEQGLNTAVRI